MKNNAPKLVYLASPYSHDSAEVRLRRFEAVAGAAGWLMIHKKVFIFSPISHCHPIEQQTAKMKGKFAWQFWAAYDGKMLGSCDEFWILCLDGWRESVGVTAETQIAKKLGLPIRYVIPQVNMEDLSLIGYRVSKRPS